MTTEQYLEQMRNIDRRIADKILEADSWRDIASSTSFPMTEDKVKSSISKDKMGDAVTMAVYCEAESRELAFRMSQTKERIIKQIDGIKDEILYNVLKGYYVNCKKIPEVARSIGYSEKTTKRYLEQAVKKFDEKYSEEYKKLSEIS